MKRPSYDKDYPEFKLKINVFVKQAYEVRYEKLGEHREKANSAFFVNIEGKAKVGEITISLYKDRANVFAPFKREVEPKRIDGICGVDINERSVDLTILKPNEPPRHIALDVSKLPAIRHASQFKRKSVQKKLDALPQRPLQKRRLKAKYWRWERNRTNQILHVVSK